MSARELIVLGTASQAPTRYRNHNGYLLRWDGEGILFDPGEGTQRQFTLAGVSPATITRMCITHFHGDHCLGLPGVIMRLALDHGRCRYRSTIRPAASSTSVGCATPRRVRNTSTSMRARSPSRASCTSMTRSRCGAPGSQHRIDTVGWRLDEPDGRRMLPDRLAASGSPVPTSAACRHEGHSRWTVER